MSKKKYFKEFFIFFNVLYLFLVWILFLKKSSPLSFFIRSFASQLIVCEISFEDVV